MLKLLQLCDQLVLAPFVLLRCTEVGLQVSARMLSLLQKMQDHLSKWPSMLTSTYATAEACTAGTARITAGRWL